MTDRHDDHNHTVIKSEYTFAPDGQRFSISIIGCTRADGGSTYHVTHATTSQLNDINEALTFFDAAELLDGMQVYQRYQQHLEWVDDTEQAASILDDPI